MLAGTLPGLALVANNLQAEIADANTRRLVLVELAGANDGLNTLVPYDNDHYHQLRPTLGLGAQQVLRISENLGLNKALGSLMPLWENGSIAWIQGLGYPQANRSHFQSIAYWEKANDGRSSRRKQGWMTHSIEHRLSRPILDPHGISLSGDLSLFASDTGRWLSTNNVRQLIDGSLPDVPSGEPDHPTLDLLQGRLRTLKQTLAQMEDRLGKTADIQPFDGGGFGEQLRQVALMIAAGLDTPVYRVRLGGFDTHENQLQRHARLLQTLASGLNSFAQHLQRLSEWHNTVVMTYSEFGRRAGENRSGGTDHGTAAPHLVIGGDIQGGLYGEMPDLGTLTNGDPGFTMDYRALYHRVLVDGLGAQNHPDSLAAFADPRLAGLV